jgi:hypothetical protein
VDNLVGILERMWGNNRRFGEQSDVILRNFDWPKSEAGNYQLPARR